MLIIIFIFSFLNSIGWIYRYQIKEYRWDRLTSTLKEKNWGVSLLIFRFQMPAKSLRNLIILFINIFIYTVLYLITSPSLLIIVFYGLLMTLFSFIVTSISVIITSLPVYVYRKRLIYKAKKLSNNFKGVAIGITGSYGKTSVKEFLFTILSERYKVAKTDKNMNTDIGIALSLLRNLKLHTQYFITEYGAYKRGEIKEETKIIKPKISILTGIGNQHIDLYKTHNNLIAEETYILSILDKTDKVYINADFSNSKRITTGIKAQAIYYSIENKEDIYAYDITSSITHTSAYIKYKEKILHIKTLLLGKHNILNLLPCIALASDLGLTVKEIEEGIKKIKPVNGKLSLHKGFNKSTILNDSLNSNVEGFIAALQLAKDLPFKQKTIISQGIIELGVEKRASYQKILDRLYGTDITLITTDTVFKALDKKNRVIVLNDVDSIINHISEININSLIIIEGRFPQRLLSKLIID